MPNTFLDSYFKGRQEKLERDQMLQQEQARQAQLAFSQQQLAQQAQQFQIQQGFEASQAAERTRQFEQQFKAQQTNQLLQNKLGVEAAIGAGQIKPVELPAIPFKGSDAPPAPGQFDLQGFGRFAPVLPAARAKEEADAKVLQQREVFKGLLGNIQTLVQDYAARGIKLDPDTELGLGLSMATGMNMMGQKGNTPSTPAGIGYNLFKTEFDTAAEAMRKGVPGARKRFDELLGPLTDFVKALEGPQAAYINTGDDALQRKQAADTYALLNSYAGAVQLSGASANADTNIANLVDHVKRQLGPGFSVEGAKDFTAQVKSLKPGTYRNLSTGPQAIFDWSTIKPKP